MCMQMRGPHFSLREQERGDQRMFMCAVVCVCGCLVYSVCVSVSAREFLTSSNSIPSFEFVFTGHITVCMYKCLLQLKDILGQSI